MTKTKWAKVLRFRRRRKEEAKRGVTHARKAAEDLRSAAGAMADEYRERGKEVLDDALHRVAQFSGRQQAIRPREPDEGSLYRARSRFRARFDLPSLEGNQFSVEGSHCSRVGQ